MSDMACLSVNLYPLPAHVNYDMSSQKIKEMPQNITMYYHPLDAKKGTRVPFNACRLTTISQDYDQSYLNHLFL